MSKSFTKRGYGQSPSLESKLYGTKEDLVTTAEFVVNAGLVV